MQPALSVIILSWNTRELLDQALDSVFASVAEPSTLEVIVVDNGSEDGSPAMVETKYPQVQLIVCEENLGFAGGNNRGLASATGDSIVLLNSDTVVLPGAFSTLSAYLHKHPHVGMVGPKLLNADGTTQSSRRRFPALPVLFFESTWLQGLASKKSLQRYYFADMPDSIAHEVDWVTGAVMMVRREVVDDVGGLDEGFFMYSEELDWCHRICDAGWAIAYTPEAEVIHYGGKSSDKVVPARHIYFQSSKVRYTRKYYGRWAAAALRTWLLGQYAWQVALEGSKWCVGHRRELRATRVKAYWQVLRSGLR